jgi:hypothetical protein
MTSSLHIVGQAGKQENRCEYPQMKIDEREQLYIRRAVEDGRETVQKRRPRGQHGGQQAGTVLARLERCFCQVSDAHRSARVATHFRPEKDEKSQNGRI